MEVRLHALDPFGARRDPDAIAAAFAQSFKTSPTARRYRRCPIADRAGISMTSQTILHAGIWRPVRDADPGIRRHHGQSGPVHHECHGGRRRLWLPPIAAVRVRPYPWHDSRVVCRRGRGRDAAVVDPAWRAGARRCFRRLYSLSGIQDCNRAAACAPARRGRRPCLRRRLSAWPSPIRRLTSPSLPYSPGSSIIGDDGALDATVKIALLGVMIVIIHLCWLRGGCLAVPCPARPHRLSHRQCLAGGGPGCRDRNRIAGLTRSAGRLPLTRTRSTARGTRRQSPAPPPGPPGTATSAPAHRPATPARSRTHRRTPRRTAARTARCPSPG